MLKSILSAPLGDDGRLGPDGRGEDATINRLEDMAAEITGKEAALLCCSGTMGNQVALMTWCNPGDKVIIDELQHLYRSEKTAFDERLPAFARCSIIWIRIVCPIRKSWNRS